MEEVKQIEKKLPAARILVVDDNENNRDMLSRRLKRRGYEVIVAEGGRQALEQVDNDTFDLILLDVMMPGVNGVEVLKTLRKSWDAHRLPIIMVTANAQTEDVVGSLELGANDYVTKPIDFPVLQARMETHLGLKQATEDLDNAYQRIKMDLTAAAAVQQNLLPSSLPRTPGIGIEWRYVPCDELAGDILNVFRLDKSHIGLYVLDVSGHGVRAALLSSALSHVLAPNGGIVRRRASEEGDWEITPPVEVARLLNERFPMDNKTMQYFTMMYGVLNVETKNFSFICAGHPGLAVLPCGSDPELIQPTGYPIGIHKDPECIEERVQLQPGCRLYLFTDGVIEAMNPEMEEFEYSRLLASLQQGRSLDLGSSLDGIIQDLSRWTGSDVRDDVTMLAIEMN